MTENEIGTILVGVSLSLHRKLGLSQKILLCATASLREDSFIGGRDRRPGVSPGSAGLILRVTLNSVTY